MSDLGSQIRHYIDDVAPAIPLDDVQQPARVGDDVAVASPSRSRTRWLSAAAAVACVAVIGTALAVSRDDTDQVEAGPGTTIASASNWDWLTTLGSEVPMPAVPDGWTSLDFEDMRFAVPHDWTVPISLSCAQPSPGWVLVSNGAESESSCSPEEAEPESVLMIEPATDFSIEGDPSQIGTLPATRVDAPDPSCADCPPTYRLENGYQVTVSGPDAADVLSTFTDSGVRRMQQEGAAAATSAWRTIEFEGLSLLVPPEWGTVDLPGSYSERETSDGAIEMSGHADPGSCGGGMFPTESPSDVYLGTSPFVPRCRAWLDLSLDPGDGIWIRSASNGFDSIGDASNIGEPVASGRVNGLDITVVQVDRLSSRTPSPVLDLVVDDGETVHWISLGVGLDTSVARSILRSLGAQGEPAEGASPRPAPRQLPEDCIWATAGTPAFIDTLVDDGLTVGFVASFESDDDSYENLFFLSAEIDGGEMDGSGDIATWASNASGFVPTADLDGGSTPSLPPYLSFVPVNDLATRISSGVGPLRVPTMDTDGAAESQECLAPRPFPVLVGLDRQDAARLLEGSGFAAEFTEVPDPVAAAGEVLRTDPDGGTPLAPGSTVTVILSMGPAPAPTTDSRLPTVSEATSTIAAPEISFTYADGTVGSLEDFAGTPVILGFFASWCGPCASQLSALQQASDEYGSAVEVLGIRTQDPSADQLADGQDVDFTVVSDPDGAALDAFAPGLPLVVLIDADGEVSRLYTGLLSADQLLEAIDENLLE